MCVEMCMWVREKDRKKGCACMTIHTITYSCKKETASVLKLFVFDEKLLTSLRSERRWLLRSPRVISSIITKVGCP